MNTNAAFDGVFEGHLEEMGYEKAQLSVEKTIGESEKFGVVGALAQLIEHERADDLFVTMATTIGFDLTDFLDHFEEKDAPTLAASDVKSREKAKSYGLVELNGQRVVEYRKSPPLKSTLVSVACYAFLADSVRFGEYLSSENSPDEPGWYLQWLQSQDPVYASFDDTWFDLETPDSYFETVEWEFESGALVYPDATVESYEIEDPSIAGTLMTDASSIEK